ncbi:MAG: carbamoyl-phosphate synthase large subunit [Hyphomicrobiales bacterium]|nr:carbamoyl-phosphate synthase large subunit [Hyphomicrobiales bacterium]
MPKRTDIASILIIGAGPIVIGQACEFDYSGTQACKALRGEGYRIILVNSNPATIMTDPDVADATYIEPITPEIVARIIEKEKPDAVLPTMGGQTALNCALALAENGVLEAYGVKLIGASPEAIRKAEDRDLFNQAMAKIGLEVPRNGIAHTLKEAHKALEVIGLPAIIRPSFTLGGSGGGIANTVEEFNHIVKSGLDASPVSQVLIDESLLGWKEFEMEVVRDCKDNCIIICSIENVDPMGVHTGDSITVAPALTLTDKEYQRMRDASCAVLREIGVETGGSNVQFAVNPENGRMVVIEMNPRVSRSSALASKATGFPIAKVAALLAVGYTLDEIRNDCTKVTPASFEPTIDYVVTKIPRFTFEKFPGAAKELTSAMKSVGEVMAIGGCFAESLQKALRSMETGLSGLDEVAVEGEIRELLKKRSPDRLRLIAQAFREGLSLQEIHTLTQYDPWFLEQLQSLVEAEKTIQSDVFIHAVEKQDPSMTHTLLSLKQKGFSDVRLASLTGLDEQVIRDTRHALGVRPVYKRVDTCAAEFEAQTPYMYGTYSGAELRLNAQAGALIPCESQPTEAKKAIILGSGPNRIGQGVEFDYACVHAAYAFKDAGYESIMVNCNPETVSTDYDTSDRLYFEPLTAEDVIELIRTEQSGGEVLGVNVQFGGQTPLKLARHLEAAGIPLLGTSHDAIDLAEDRERFKALLEKLDLKQPENAICRTEEEVRSMAEEIGYPVVVRPSYVLGGRAMAIVHDREGLTSYLSEVREFFKDGPILLDGFLQHAVEIDVDVISDGKETYVAGVMEHIEEAGVHSGDSACSLPVYSLSPALEQRIRDQAVALATALNVCGLMNVQFAVKDDDIYVLEVNPRASRTVPFVAKATGVPVAKIAARVMAGETLKDFTALLDKGRAWQAQPGHVAVKEVVLPFHRFPGVDVILGPEMKSTGEVMGIDRHFEAAFAKAQLGSGTQLPVQGAVFISVKDDDKEIVLGAARKLEEMGFALVATRGTANFLSGNGVQVEPINKVREGSPHIVDRMLAGEIDLVINTTEGAKSIADSFSIRHTALMQKIPYTTTATGARELVRAIRRLREEEGLEVLPLQAYFG